MYLIRSGLIVVYSCGLFAQSAISPSSSQPKAAPRFDVASIRPCNRDAVPPVGRGGLAPTDTIRLNCVKLKSVIENAYIRFAGGLSRSPMLTPLTKIEGGPQWINSDLYTIEAKSEGVQSVLTRAGPMMQALLEDRFQLKVHRETREGPIYELTIAKGGAKLRPVRKGPCTAADFAGSTMPFFSNDDRQCNLMLNKRKGANAIAFARSASMENFSALLTVITGQLVVDKTGISGPIDFRLEYLPEENVAAVDAAAGEPASDDPPAPSIFAVLQDELRLKLERARGPREYLVIDHIERPSAN